jgi:hypothetical protein
MLHYAKSALRLSHFGTAFECQPIQRMLPSATRQLHMPAFNYQPEAYVGPSREDVMTLRSQHLNPGELSIPMF